MIKKYKLGDIHPTYDMYRVVALRDFDDVKAGDVGGWVEGEHKLSHEGDCWVYREAMVWGNAKVSGNAKIYDHAKIGENSQVYGNTHVYDNAQVQGNAQVYGNASVSDDAKVYGNARVYGNASVSDDAKVYGNANMSDDAKVYGNASVSDDAKVHGKAKVSGNSRVFDNAQVYGNAKVFGKAGVYGNSRVFQNARVYWNAKVSGNDKISGNTEVYGKAEVYNNVKVCNQELSSGKYTNEEDIINLTKQGDVMIANYAKILNKGILCGPDKAQDNNDVCSENLINSLYNKKVETVNLTKQGESKMKETALKLRETIAPYEKYILIAAVLIAVDYFIFKGGLSDRIKKLAGKLVERLESILDKAINKIGL